MFSLFYCKISYTFHLKLYTPNMIKHWGFELGYTWYPHFPEMVIMSSQSLTVMHVVGVFKNRSSIIQMSLFSILFYCFSPSLWGFSMSLSWYYTVWDTSKVYFSCCPRSLPNCNFQFSIFLRRMLKTRFGPW